MRSIMVLGNSNQVISRRTSRNFCKIALQSNADTPPRPEAQLRRRLIATQPHPRPPIDGRQERAIPVPGGEGWAGIRSPRVRAPLEIGRLGISDMVDLEAVQDTERHGPMSPRRGLEMVDTASRLVAMG